MPTMNQEQHMALASVSSIPRDEEGGPVFAAPWQAQAFAMALTLHAKGVFEWTEWADELHQQIRKAQSAGDPDTGESYYLHWLATLESLVVKKGIANHAQLDGLYSAWDKAAHSTPHGQAIELPDGVLANHVSSGA